MCVCVVSPSVCLSPRWSWRQRRAAQCVPAARPARTHASHRPPTEPPRTGPVASVVPLSEHSTSQCPVPSECQCVCVCDQALAVSHPWI